MTAAARKSPAGMPPPRDDELRAFLIVLREALVLIVRFIERRYGLRPYETPRRRVD